MHVALKIQRRTQEQVVLIVSGRMAAAYVPELERAVRAERPDQLAIDLCEVTLGP
jgi:hypothetical protein